MKLIGDPNSIKTCIIAHEMFQGSILPHRNCNLPSEYYDFQQYSLSALTLNLIKIKQMNYKDLNFKEFENLDLDKINKQYLQSEHFDELKRLLNHLITYKIIVENLDVGIKSSYKIIVLDKDGNLVDGSDNSDEEFHTMRLELVYYKFPWFALPFIGDNLEGKKFMLKQLKNFYLQHTIVDFDGFMNKNLIILT